MQLNAELAEVVGALLGDGCLSCYFARTEKRWRWEVAFTGSRFDFPYYREFVSPAFQQNFGVKGRLFIRKSDNSTRFHIANKRVFEFFQNLGIPVGDKPNSMAIPPAIMTDKEFRLACVRGIWNTDGSIFRRYTKQFASQKKFYPHYLVMALKMNAKPLLEQAKKILVENGIETTRITKSGDAHVLRITKQESIQAYLEIVGFSNKHHLDRLEGFHIRPFKTNATSVLA
ncbi:MAG: LAGLIDADG family homing endonuclease [Candidatus Diapherotrites archaeon]